MAAGSYAFAGQYQQAPAPRGGGVFKTAWWQYVDVLPKRFDEVAQSWDLSFKGGDQHDFVVGLVAGRIGAEIYLLDRLKGHFGFQETVAAMQTLRERYPQTVRTFVEDAANGPAVFETLKRSIPGVIAVRPEGGKFSRAAACEPRVEAGQVYLPRPRTVDGRLITGRTWVEDFVETLAVFPNGEHDDDVDAFTQLPPASKSAATRSLAKACGDSQR